MIIKLSLEPPELHLINPFEGQLVSETATAMLFAHAQGIVYLHTFGGALKIMTGYANTGHGRHKEFCNSTGGISS